MIAEVVEVSSMGINWPGAVAIVGVSFAIASIMWATAWEKSRKNRYKDD